MSYHRGGAKEEAKTTSAASDTTMSMLCWYRSDSFARCLINSRVTQGERDDDSTILTQAEAAAANIFASSATESGYLSPPPCTMHYAK